MISNLSRLVYIIYFVTHIPITICVDMQGLFPHIYPAKLTNMFSWYISTYNDPLMASPPVWLRTFLILEAFVQLPFFFWAAYCLCQRLNVIRIPMVAYGAHVATTVAPILMEFIMDADLTKNEKATLVSFYSPYLVIPLMLLWEFSRHAEPLTAKKTKAKTK